MTLRQLRADAEYWQGMLNIPEWKLTVRWGKKREMQEEVGRCWWSAEEAEAWIEIARDDKTPRATLIHEMLHIVLQGHTTHDGSYCEMHERAINRITAALHELRKAA